MWKAKDAIQPEKVPLEKKVMTQKKIEQVYDGANADIEQAISFAETSPYPAPEDLLTDVYNQEQRHERSSENRGSSDSLRACDYRGCPATEEQDNVFVAGEDVGEAGSVYGYYRGLIDQFGEHRIIDTPISEKGIGLGWCGSDWMPSYSGHYVHGLWKSVWTKSLTKWPRCDLCLRRCNFTYHRFDHGRQA